MDDEGGEDIVAKTSSPKDDKCAVFNESINFSIHRYAVGSEEIGNTNEEKIGRLSVEKAKAVEIEDFEKTSKSRRRSILW